MHCLSRLRSLFVLPLAMAALQLFAAPAAAHGGAVYSMTNDTQQNAVAMFARAEDGSLSAPVLFPTGGQGTGENLGSTSSLALSDNERFLLVVNAGSDSISSFKVHEDALELIDTQTTGQLKPVSLDVHGRFVAVLSAGGDVGGRDSVRLFALTGEGRIHRLPQSPRALSEGTTSPAQIAFAQDGGVLVVTEKRTEQIATFRVRPNGRLSRVQLHESVGRRPFGLARGERDKIFVAEATGGSVTSYKIRPDGALVVIDPAVATNQLMPSSVTTSRGAHFAYVTNALSASVSAFSVDFEGKLQLLDATGVSATTGTGPIEAATSDDGRLLYVLGAADGSVSGFRIQADGTLVPLSPVNGLPAGSNGLAAR